MKPVNIEYIKEYLRLHESNESFEDNSNMIAFVKKWYGPTAYKITGQITSEYNDEGYSGRLDHINVYDAQGRELEEMEIADENYQDDFWDARDGYGASDIGSEYEEEIVIYTEQIPLVQLYIK